MVSCKHDAATIGFMLTNFKYYTVKHNFKWPVFKHVTDFSFALLNSVSYFCNCMSLQTYINKTYLSVTENLKLEADLSFTSVVHIL